MKNQSSSKPFLIFLSKIFLSYISVTRKRPRAGLSGRNARFEINTRRNKTVRSPHQLVWQEAKSDCDGTCFPVGQANRGSG